MKLVVWFRDGSDAESQIKPVTDIVASIEYVLIIIMVMLVMVVIIIMVMLWMVVMMVMVTMRVPY